MCPVCSLSSGWRQKSSCDAVDGATVDYGTASEREIQNVTVTVNVTMKVSSSISESLLEIDFATDWAMLTGKTRAL
jgi:hypothetical protein